MRVSQISVLFASLVVTSLAIAHDFWVQPSKFHPAIDELVKVHLHVGHAGEIDDIKRNPERIDKFIVAGPDGVQDVPGKDAEAPAGFIRPQKAGLYLIGFRSRHSFIELAAAEFEEYLRYEGLEQVIAKRKERGESTAPGKEMYSRCAKSLLVVGTEQPTDADRTLGFRLELIALKNPYTLKPGDELPLQLLLDSKPCAGVMVKLKNPTSTSEEALTSARSDADGKVSLKIDAPGLRLVNAVQMIEAPKDNTFGAQWESLWASMTFEVAGKPE